MGYCSIKKFLAGVLAAISLCCAACALSACAGDRAGGGAGDPPPEGYSAYTADINYRFSITSEQECPAGNITEDKLHSDKYLNEGETYYLVLDLDIKNFNWADEDISVETYIFSAKDLTATLHEAATADFGVTERQDSYLITTRYTVPRDRNAQKSYRIVYEVKMTETTGISADFAINGMDFAEPFETGSSLQLEFNAETQSYTVTGISSSAKTVTIPDYYEGYPVTAIAEGAFLHKGIYYGDGPITAVIMGKNIAAIGKDAFRECSNLKGVYIGDLTAWCNIFFANAYSNPLSLTANLNGAPLTELEIPQGITEIKQFAFNNCYELERVTVPDGVTAIGAGAFGNCSRLTNINIPDGVTSVGAEAFSGCGFESIEIPESVTSVGAGAFRWCSNLSGIVIPENVTNVAAETFCGCSALSGIVIPESVTSIGDGAFYGCSSLKHISIPESVTSIGDRAFEDCGSLTEITIPESVTSIGDGAFERCSFADLTIPNNVLHIGAGAFSGCDKLESVTLPFVGSSADSENFAYLFTGVPASLKTVTITGGETIRSNAFSNCSNIESVTLPESVASIGAEAFSGCSSLKHISIPDGVTSIDWDAFYGCSNLAEIEIPASVTSVGNGAFGGCSNLADIEIPNGVTSVGRDAFENCTRLTEITVPKSVTSIGGGAFRGCNKLESITLPFVGSGSVSTHFAVVFGASKDEDPKNYVPASLKTVTITGGETIRSNAFYKCAGIRRVTLSGNITHIEEYAFRDCTGLRNISISESVTSVACNAFENCTELISKDATLEYVDKWAIKCNGAATVAYLRDDTVGIAEYAFYECKNLTEIVIPENVAHICDWAFESCKELKTVYFGTGSRLASIGDKAFESCTNLTEITIPESVTYIGEAAFNVCKNLTHINIPANVANIGDRAFHACDGLKRVDFEAGGKLTSLGNHVFSTCGSLTDITIPESVTSLGYRAFAWCGSLTEITIPAGVTDIGTEAFLSCTELKSVVFEDKAMWAVSQNGVAWENVSVADPESTAEKFTKTYTYYVWKRMGEQ